MIIPATAEHADALDVRLPWFDQYLRAFGKTKSQLLRDEIAFADEAWTWSAPEIGCIFGITTKSVLDPPVFWLYPGPAVREQRMAFLRECKRLRPYFTDKYPQIAGWCFTSFPESLRFLQWMGATIHDTQSPQLKAFHVKKGLA